MPLATSSNIFSSQALSSTSRSVTGQRIQPAVSAMREMKKNVATENNVDRFPSLRILEAVLGVTHPSKFIQEPAVVVKQSNIECVPTMSNYIIAVAEFKGPEVHGVVRFEQGGGGDGEPECSIEANIDGLSPGKHGWGVHEFGDLTRGAHSTGPAYTFHGADDDVDLVTEVEEGMGNLGSLDVNNHGHVQSVGSNGRIVVSDIIGRSVVLYGDGDERVAAAVIARSARPSSLSPQLCHCDGSFMWQGGNNNGCS